MESGLISLGKMAEMSQLSVAALRLYDELGLLKPKYKDPETGYRYYAPQQLEVFHVIETLRELDLPAAGNVDQFDGGEAIRRADKLMYWAKQKRNDVQT